MDKKKKFLDASTLEEVEMEQILAAQLEAQGLLEDLDDQVMEIDFLDSID